MNRFQLSSLAFVAVTLSGVGFAHAESMAPTSSILVTDDVAELLKQGKAHLKDNQLDEALAKFEAADKASGQDPDTRVWVLRTWMEMGRLNDAFLEAEKMMADGVKTAGIDYLFGVGSLKRARNLIEAGGNPGMAFGDAVSYLQAAMDAEPDKYPDGWLALAHSSWYALELERGLAAADKAIAYDPKSSLAYSIKGELHFSSYKDLRQRAKEGEAVPADHAKQSLTAFSRAAELTPDDKGSATEQLAIWRQIGNVHAWLADLPKASEAFAEGLSWSPAGMDYNLLIQTLAPKGDMKVFNSTLSQGLTGYKKRFGEESPDSAMLLWWLGYGQMKAKDFEVAEASFRESIARNKDYLNSWFYVGLCRYQRADYKGSCEAWLTYWDGNSGSLVASIRQDESYYMPMLEFASGKVIATGYTREGGLEALQIGERMNQVFVAVRPTSGVYWNNLGLLRRDIGERLDRPNQDVKPEEILAIYESSWTAYQKAVTLVKNDPGYLNDAAVLLQYYLGRDLEMAKEYYTQAAKEAAVLIEDESWKNLPENEQAAEEQRIRLALRDAGDNMRKMEAGEVGTRHPDRDKRPNRRNQNRDASAGSGAADQGSATGRLAQPATHR